MSVDMVASIKAAATRLAMSSMSEFIRRAVYEKMEKEGFKDAWMGVAPYRDNNNDEDAKDKKDKKSKKKSKKSKKKDKKSKKKGRA